jgi:hypothetical protein
MSVRDTPADRSPWRVYSATPAPVCSFTMG